MDRKDIKKVLDELTGDIDTIADKKAVAIIKILINLVEMLAEENARLKKTVQELKDEINRLATASSNVQWSCAGGIGTLYGGAYQHASSRAEQ